MRWARASDVSETITSSAIGVPLSELNRRRRPVPNCRPERKHIGRHLIRHQGFKNRGWDMLELHRHLRHPLRKPFGGTQIKRYALPVPIVALDPQRGESFSCRGGRNAFFMAVGRSLVVVA